MTKRDADSVPPPERYHSETRLRVTDLDDDADTPRLLLIATFDSNLDAWAVKWALQAEGILAHLGHRDAARTDVYVLAKDAARALAIIEREDGRKTA